MVRSVLETMRQSLPWLLKIYARSSDDTFNWRARGTVYQYTRFSTLRGVLGGDLLDTSRPGPVLRDIWATSSKFLNDSEEFDRGRSVLKSAILDLREGRIRDAMLSALEDSHPLEVYVACFSAVDDDLSQWRGYGDNGSGVCLGFDLETVISGLDGVGFWVIYGRQGDDYFQQDVAEGIVGYLYGTFSTHYYLRDASEAVFDEFRLQLTEIWPTLCLAFKHSAFAAEQEFRVVYSQAIGRHISPSFRAPVMTPFVKLEMRDSRPIPLTSVRLGPGVSTEANLRSVRLALDRCSLPSINVEPSGIPYVPR